MNNINADNISEKDSYKAAYAAFRQMTEDSLDRYLPDVDERSQVLRNAMSYSLNAGGKRLRPVLLLAACEAVGGDVSAAVPFACAIEFIHTYSLIHDDHPSMDNDDLRRGKPTNHKVFGDDIAILAGDGLLNSAMDVMLESVMAEASYERKERFVKAAYEISRAAGVRGMVAGQTADVIMTGGGTAYSSDNSTAAYKDKEDVKNNMSEAQRMEMLRYIHKNKTGALIRAAVRAGAFIGGADEVCVNAMTEYAENTGLVFQIVDDILDVVGDEQQLGKKTGVDEELGKLTYPSLFGLERSYELAAEFTERAINALERLNVNSGFLAKLAIDLKDRIS